MMTWSIRDRSQVFKALFSACVWVMSARLGRALPDGWLWTSIRADAFLSRAFLIIARLSIIVLSSPPLLTISLAIIRLALFRKSAQHSSWSRSLISGCIISNTFCGEDNWPPESSAAFKDARRPISNAAAMVTALLGPIPLMARRRSMLPRQNQCRHPGR